LSLGGPVPTNVSYGWFPEFVANSRFQFIYINKRHSAAYVVDEIKKGADIKTAMLQNYKFPIDDEIEQKIRELVDTNQDWAAR
jgi:hypothetical protein